jgi:uncharacterized protein DUF3800
MLLFFLDDSGTDNQAPVITMAGYVASRLHWQMFEKRARRLYRRYAITQLHAKEFHDTDGQFAGWTRIKKMTFVQELYTLANRHVMLGVSVSIQKEGYKKAAARTGLNKDMSAFGQCFGIVCEYILKHDQLAEQAAKGLSFRVEAGNKNNNDVKQRFEALRGHRQLEDALKTMVFVGKDHSVAIQLADFLAFYSRRHCDKCERERNARTPHDEPLATMINIVPHDGLLANNFFGRRPGHENLPGV